MEFNLFIVPATMILTELIKPLIPSKYYPLTAVLIGLILGLVYGSYYGQDLFVHGFTGLVYGASASGIYDIAKSTVRAE